MYRRRRPQPPASRSASGPAPYVSSLPEGSRLAHPECVLHDPPDPPLQAYPLCVTRPSTVRTTIQKKREHAAAPSVRNGKFILTREHGQPKNSTVEVAQLGDVGDGMSQRCCVRSRTRHSKPRRAVSATPVRWVIGTADESLALRTTLLCGLVVVLKGLQSQRPGLCGARTRRGMAPAARRVHDGPR